MDIGWILNGLSLQGKSKSGLAKAIGRSPSAVTDILSGRRRLRADEIPMIAEYLGVDPPRTITKAKVPALAELPVLGFVGASIWRETVEETKPKMVAAARDARFPDAKQFLLRVVGDSMNAAEPPIPDGSLIRCIAWADTGMAPRTGLLVVARRTDGNLAETTIKRIHVFPDRVELRPESYNPDHKPIIVRDHNAEIIALVTMVLTEIQI